MPEWSPERTVDEALARRLIAGQHFAPTSLRLIGEGWNNTVWLADERYAFRFPRRAIAILPDDPMGRADMGIRVARAVESIAVLARYGAEEGMVELRDEALASYERASRAL